MFLFFCLWKRQCFMAIESRSHMCISCCTNIVQCSAWNKARVEASRQAGSSFHEQLIAGYSSISIIQIGLSHKHRPVCLWIKPKKKRGRSNASLLFKTVKEIWVKTQLRIEKKESKPFYGDFPLPPPLPCGDFWQRAKRQSILSPQLLSIFRDKQKKRGGRAGACATMFKDSRRAGSVFCAQHFQCLKQVFQYRNTGV